MAASVPTVLYSASAAVRVDAARRFVESVPPAGECLVVGEDRAAADDFVRDLSTRGGARFGLRRCSLRQLAAELAATELARRGCVPAAGLNVEAVAARVAFEERKAGTLGRLAAVSRVPSFARTLASTLDELRHAGVDLGRLAGLGAAATDLAVLARRYDHQLAEAGLVDRAGLLRTAAAAAAGGEPLPPGPILLLDVAVPDDATRALVEALAARAPRLLATVPAGDRRTLETLAQLPGVRLERPPQPDGPGALARVRRYLFTADAPPPRPAAPAADSDVVFFSAPGEGRECVEIARAILKESAGGVPLDRMAILVRAPHVYAAPLETALSRAATPAWFARGTRTPDPSGRALLALLACAAERLSARRFAEYLSIAQAPSPGADGAPPKLPPVWRHPEHAAELLPAPALPDQPPVAAAETDLAEDPGAGGQTAAFDAPRAPWQWHRLLVDAAVVGGLDRWRRRLAGLAQELELRRAACARDDPQAARLQAIERDLRDLGHLQRFALPVIERLAAFPDEAPWGDWLDALEALVPMTLRQPDRVLAVLGELRPMSRVGPVTLGEVRDVLSERLSELPAAAPAQRYGRVFVGRPEHARGRLFDVVFVPGLAERIFPQKHRQDPLLLDESRRILNDGADGGPGLPTQDDRAGRERLLLQVASGAATRRLYLSYPRFHVADARPRVPSFYALDVERALTGRVPDFRDLERRAGARVDARLDWPAPAVPDDAIDDAEHDLAVLGPLLRREVEGELTGRARYLLELNPGLRRSLVARWARWKRPWSRFDGLHGLAPESTAALAAYRLSSRPYSVSALQRFAVCPYQFLLAAIYRLEPRPDLQPLERMDPLTRGRLFHEVQAELLRALWRRGAVPLTHSGLDAAEAALDAVLDQVAGDYREALAPAIDRVWADEVEAMRLDLKGWLQNLAEEGAAWTPTHAEFGFGFAAGAGRDEKSVPEPVAIDGRWLLHGVVDLIEAETGSPTAGALRVTDHKTGRNRHPDRIVVRGGEVLQPVLYALAVEQALQRQVVESRLVFCTVNGNFSSRPVSLGDSERRRGVEVLEIVDRAIETGSLLPAPRKDACTWCDFKAVCGPWEEVRSGRKDTLPLADLRALRAMR